MEIDKQNCECTSMSDDKLFAKISEMIDYYANNRGSLIQILYTAQEIYGYLPLKLQRFIAEKLGFPLSKIYGVTTFYSFFSTKPRGKYTIRICLGTACYIKGAKQILNKLREVLGIDVGETTEDGKFTLEVMRCVGACGLSPVITINGKVYKRAECLNIEDILKEYINQ